jgi:hypothetical protein
MQPKERAMIDAKPAVHPLSGSSRMHATSRGSVLVLLATRLWLSIAAEGEGVPVCGSGGATSATVKSKKPAKLTKRRKSSLLYARVNSSLVAGLWKFASATGCERCRAMRATGVGRQS